MDSVIKFYFVNFYKILWICLASVCFMHDALVRGRRSELRGAPAPLSTPTRATLAVRALRLALNSFYCGYAAWNSIAVNFKILLYLKFKNSKILLRRILPLEFRLWRRFLSRGKGRYLLYFAVLARNAARLKLCITTLVLRGAPLSL